MFRVVKAINTFLLIYLLVFQGQALASPTAQDQQFKIDTPIVASCGENYQYAGSGYTEISSSLFLQYAWPCAKNFFMGAWDASGGQIVSAGKCIFSPI